MRRTPVRPGAAPCVVGEVVELGAACPHLRQTPAAAAQERGHGGWAGWAHGAESIVDHTWDQSATTTSSGSVTAASSESEGPIAASKRCASTDRTTATAAAFFPSCEGSGSSFTNTLKQQPAVAGWVAAGLPATRLLGWRCSAGGCDHAGVAEETGCVESTAPFKPASGVGPLFRNFSVARTHPSSWQNPLRQKAPPGGRLTFLARS